MRRAKQDDLAEINAWLEARKLKQLEPAALPKFGVIEPGVMAGFLVDTDCNVVMLDHFVSNPAIPRRSVSNAVDQAVLCLCIAAKNKGKRVLVISKRRSILRRAARWGFASRGVWGRMAMEA